MRDRHPVQLAALASGAVFLLVGILGFIQGITTSFSTMTFAGHESDAMRLGVVEVSVLHSSVRLLFGGAGIAMCRTIADARNYLVGAGAIYLVRFLYGLVIDHEIGANSGR